MSLGLLHGSQPDLFVVCHEPGRHHLLGYPDFALPAIEEVIDMTTRLGRRTNLSIRCAGVSLDTQKLDGEAAQTLCLAERERLGLPVADPMRGGSAFDRLADAAVRDSGDV